MKNCLVLIVMSFLISGVVITDSDYYSDYHNNRYDRPRHMSERRYQETRDYQDIGNSNDYEDDEPIDTFDPDLDSMENY